MYSFTVTLCDTILIVPNPTASEFQNWMLLYSLPILQGRLPDDYFIHFTKLVTAISILLGCEITSPMLTRAKDHIEEFCKDMELLYGKYLLFIRVNYLHSRRVNILLCRTVSSFLHVVQL